eukprot:CAMPEP_0204088178 /NCGR_PEP_ID=MMETSP0360-20130528/185809_1 /ASSEMBLY_ACC=CAM_ASM_000342 /TAXON_ID=268821 /ORGANISM="Scrippsiella Hangoei, Strain SHTV-5" /LENGTH=141 /DNA_ID=CAMNT_0051037353 /DNA_START=287 /DNA_END=709 /DNA_ORIENTATION=+
MPCMPTRLPSQQFLGWYSPGSGESLIASFGMRDAVPKPVFAVFGFLGDVKAHDFGPAYVVMSGPLLLFSSTIVFALSIRSCFFCSLSCQMAGSPCGGFVGNDLLPSTMEVLLVKRHSTLTTPYCPGAGSYIPAGSIRAYLQ